MNNDDFSNGNIGGRGNNQIGEQDSHQSAYGRNITAKGRQPVQSIYQQHQHQYQLPPRQSPSQNHFRDTSNNSRSSASKSIRGGQFQHLTGSQYKAPSMNSMSHQYNSISIHPSKPPPSQQVTGLESKL